jgi:hypothetical protein
MGFKKGQPKVPGSGRRKGSLNHGTVRTRRLIAEQDDTDIVKQTVTAAKGGDIAAQGLYYRFLRPRPANLNPTPLEVPEPKTIEDVRALCGKLAIEVLAGALDTDAASVTASLLKSIESSIVSHDLAVLLERLKSEGKP